MTAEEGADLDQEFVVRRAIIPRPGFVFFMPDMMQMEYRLLMDYAASGVGYKTPLVESILSGLDVHEAARLEILKHGIDLPREWSFRYPLWGWFGYSCLDHQGYA